MGEAPARSDSSEVFRYGGSGTILLISLLLFVGIGPLLIHNTASRIAGGAVLATILVTGTVTASRSYLLRAIGGTLAASALALQVLWILTDKVAVHAAMLAAFATFCLFTAVVILRHVLAFGPVYADRVHAALSVYVLLALFWAGAYALVETLAPGSFSVNVASADAAELHRNSGQLMASMIHLSIATLTSTGYGDITPVGAFARSLSQIEQLVGVFYIAVLISRLVGLYPTKDGL